MIKYISATAILLILPFLLNGNADRQDDWETLFNGKDLSGWYTYQRTPEPSSEVPGIPRDDEGNYLEPIGLNKDPLNVFSVVEEDGEPAIRISGETFGILVTEKEFEDYHLSLQFKWGEKKYPPRADRKRDSGVLYHSIGPEGSWGGVWMKSLECQVQETDCGDFILVDSTFASIPAQKTDGEFHYDQDAEPVAFEPGKAYCNHNKDYEKPNGQWNTIEIYTAGGNSVHLVNGHVNMRAYRFRHLKNGKIFPLTKGKIQLQSEGAEVFYRHIRLRPIDGIPDTLTAG